MPYTVCPDYIFHYRRTWAFPCNDAATSGRANSHLPYQSNVTLTSPVLTYANGLDNIMQHPPGPPRHAPVASSSTNSPIYSQYHQDMAYNYQNTRYSLYSFMPRFLIMNDKIVIT